MEDFYSFARSRYSVRSFSGEAAGEEKIERIVALGMCAHAEGLGMTWCGSFDEPLLKSLFPDMAGYSIIALFPIGYPSANSAQLNLHDISKPQDEMLAVV